MTAPPVPTFMEYYSNAPSGATYTGAVSVVQSPGVSAAVLPFLAVVVFTLPLLVVLAFRWSTAPKKGGPL